MVHETMHSRALEFVPNIYYIFNNPVIPNTGLAADRDENNDGIVTMRPINHSSQNWQLYFQQGRYFIRNYDFGGSYQLGLTKDSVIPKLIKRSGALAQQWILVRQEDGTHKFYNGLLGNNTALAFTAVTGNVQPAMQSAGTGSTWSLVANPDAQPPKDPTMMQDNTDFEIEKVVSSSTSSTASTSQPTGTNTANLPSTSTPNNGGAPAAGSSSLAPGAIAGISIGAVLVLALVALISYFLWGYRKSKQTQFRGTELSSQTERAHVGHIHLNYGRPVQLHGETVMYEMEHK